MAILLRVRSRARVAGFAAGGQTAAMTSFPAALTLSLDTTPPPELRAMLAREINQYHARTVPGEARRFTLALRDGDGGLAAGLSGAMMWDWLFVDAVWVGDGWRGQGIGAGLLALAEDHAMSGGCHSVWLDSFQARDFYLRLGYAVFGALDDYPPGQTRYFLRKRLRPAEPVVA